MTNSTYSIEAFSIQRFLNAHISTLGMVKYIHDTADVSKAARIGKNVYIWHQCQIRENASIGDNCILGKNVYVDHHVKIGNNVKIQNNCSIYFGSQIEDGVFIGPHVCLTNDKIPRAITKEGRLKGSEDWSAAKILIKKGASIGAASVILPNIVIGQFAMIGAASVVTKNVPDYALVYGNPAKLISYVCKCGRKITKIEEIRNNLILYCPKCKEKIKITKNYI